MTAPFRELAQHDRGEMRVAARLGGDDAEEVADFPIGERRTLGDRAHARTDRVEGLLKHGAVERLLIGEVVVNHRLVQAGAARDAVDAGAGVAAVGEFGGGGVEEPIAGAGDGTGHLRPAGG
jgi:hypothetical protein